jgi:hypothetical protein
MLDPLSPSLHAAGAADEWRAVHYDALNHEINALLAIFVTGVQRYRSQLVALRHCCRSLRVAIDGAVDSWCAQFSALRKVWAWDYGGCRRATLSMINGEWVYKAQTEMVAMWERAFVGGESIVTHPTLRNFMFVNRINRDAFYCALAERCALCGEHILKGQTTAYYDAHQACGEPVYAFAHINCQKKHMVCIKGPWDQCDAVRTTEEPRELHRELQAVHHLLKLETQEEGTIFLSKKLALYALSPWFKCVQLWQAHITDMPLWVWLRPHPLVRKEDTLYGALGITAMQVMLAVREQEERSALAAQQAFRRKEELRENRKRLARAYEAELRVWLGKGKTRWRTIEHAEAMHEDLLKSAGMQRFLRPDSYQRVPTTASEMVPCLHVLHLFSATLDHVARAPSPELLDCLIGKIGLQNIYIKSAMDLQLIDEAQLDRAVANESHAYACILDGMDAMPDSAINTVHTVIHGNTSCIYTAHYGVRVNCYMKLCEELITFTTQLYLSHEDLCMLKYRVREALPEEPPELRARLHLPIPSGSTTQEASGMPSTTAINHYLHNVFGACLQSGAAGARTIALALLFDYKLFSELRETIARRQLRPSSPPEGGLSPEDPIPQPHLGGYFPNEEPRVAMEED